jgi:zinc protease
MTPTASRRFVLPAPGAATPVRFPAVVRDALPNGLGVWSMRWTAVPVVAVALVIVRGAADDPPGQPGLVSLAADLIDEGAGGRDAVRLAEAFADLGTHLEVEVGADTTVLAMTTLARVFVPALALLADVVLRPHLAEVDLTRVRELRSSRLRQLKTSAGAAADRAFLTGLFGRHPYGHGVLGTTAALEAATLEDVRRLHAGLFTPADATLIVAGDVPPETVAGAAREALGRWSASGAGVPAPVEAAPAGRPRLLLVDRPGAPQSELRIGQIGPGRQSDDYHALVALNAALGGQFTSRINQHLRETRGYTYGARTALEFRRRCSTLACDTSVQSDATADAVADVLGECEAVASTRPIDAAELARACQALTRGYVRRFETPASLVRAAAELLTLSLPDDTFDRFVPALDHLTADDVLRAARRVVRVEETVVAVVGDADSCRSALSRLGRDVVDVTPEF